MSAKIKEHFLVSARSLNRPPSSLTGSHRLIRKKEVAIVELRVRDSSGRKFGKEVTDES